MALPQTDRLRAGLPCILAFDTSAAHCAAALLRGSEVLAERHEDMAKGQAERLMPLLEELLAEAGLGWSDLAGVGVGTGPGNFTGVRIAVAAARGLALALGIPAIGVSTLEALAEAGPRPLAVLLDARRDEVYMQVFPAGGDPLVPQLCPASALPAELAEDGTGIWLVGSGAAAARQSMAMTAGVIAPALPLAEAIGRVALRRLGTAQPRPAPLYLRGADAAPPSDPPPVLLD